MLMKFLRALMIQALFVICFVCVCNCDKLLLDFSGEVVFVQYTFFDYSNVFLFIDTGNNLT